MGFSDLFWKNDSTPQVKLTERKQNTMQDSAAAVAFAEAGEHETALAMVGSSAGSKKILVIGREDSFSDTLIEYAVDMAKRWRYEILALNVTKGPLSLSATVRDNAAELFRKNCLANVVALQTLAEQKGVAVSHRVEIGDQDTIVESVHAEFPGLRYALTEPDPEVTQGVKGRVEVPVFDLGSFHGAIA